MGDAATATLSPRTMGGWRWPRLASRPRAAEGAVAADETDKKANSKQFGANEMVEVVFVIEDDVAVMRMVKTGITGESKIEILEGVDEGEMVVTGSYRILSKTLKDGDDVKIEDKNKKKGKWKKNEHD